MTFGEETQLSLSTIIGVSLAQFLVAIYGGYFGGGIGILMLATLALIGHGEYPYHECLKSATNYVLLMLSPSVTFIIANAVIWPQAILMIMGAIIGGYGGAYFCP